MIFDRDGLFETSQALPSTSAPHATGVHHDITTYWIYIYLNGKYYSRKDTYKMLYVQQVLFQTHLKVLLKMSGITPAGWWVSDIHHLSENHQKDLKVYFPTPDIPAIVRAIGEEIDLFARDARDARAACEQNAVEYPNDLAEWVRRHLLQLGVISSPQSVK